MEHVDGFSFQNMDASSCPDLHASLFKLGTVLLFDLLVNNFDRIPMGSVWGNYGNPGNIIVGKNGEVFIIDQTITSIQNEAKLQEYLSKINQLIKLSATEQLLQFESVQKSIFNWTNVNIGEDDLKKVQEGFAFALKELKAMSLEKFEQLVDLSLRRFAELLDAVPGDKESSFLAASFLVEQEIKFLKQVILQIIN
jgi:hypothetical protein